MTREGWLACLILVAAHASGCNPNRISIGGNDVHSDSAAGSGGNSGSGGSAASAGSGGSSGLPSSGGVAGAFDPNARYSVLISPTSGETFTEPATLRLIAAGHDPNVFTEPAAGRGGNAARVEFFVDDERVLTVDGSEAEYWVFKGFASGIAAGPHRVWARAIYTNPDAVIDSAAALIVVDAPPAYAQTVDLEADITLSANADYTLVGAAQGRIRLNGHGHSLKTSAGATGSLVLKFVDVFDLGNPANTAERAIDVSTAGTVTLEDCRFDTSNTIALGQTPDPQAGPISIQRNTFRSNMRMPLGASIDASGPEASASYPLLELGGNTDAVNVFAGNNVGAGLVSFNDASNWLIGGDTDQDSNVLIGPRVGFFVTSSTDLSIRRNFSHDVYYGGWSGSDNLTLSDSTATVEHNVIYGGSWPVRGSGGEFRYNLVVDAGQGWLTPGAGSSVHHNVLVGGENQKAGLSIYNVTAQPGAPALSIANNTVDALDTASSVAMVAIDATSGPVTLSSNAFIRLPKKPVVVIAGGPLTADYNGFFGAPQAAYSDGRAPAHDLSGGDALLGALPASIFDLDEVAIWQRSTTTAAILTLYRTRYAPTTASPLLGAGDPTLATDNYVGAVGAGLDPEDRFGKP